MTRIKNTNPRAIILRKKNRYYNMSTNANVIRYRISFIVFLTNMDQFFLLSLLLLKPWSCRCYWVFFITNIKSISVLTNFLLIYFSLYIIIIFFFITSPLSFLKKEQILLSWVNNTRFPILFLFLQYTRTFFNGFLY